MTCCVLCSVLQGSIAVEPRLFRRVVAPFHITTCKLHEKDIFYSRLRLARLLSTQGQLYRDWAFPPHSANWPCAWWTLIGTSSPCFTIFGVIPNLEIISLSRGTACRCPSSTLVLAGRSRRVLREGTDADSAAVPISVNRLSSFSSSKGRSLFECKRSLQGLCRCESFTIMKLLWIQ